MSPEQTLILQQIHDRLGVLEADVKKIVQFRGYVVGMAAAVSIVVSVVAKFLIRS